MTSREQVEQEGCFLARDTPALPCHEEAEQVRARPILSTATTATGEASAGGGPPPPLPLSGPVSGAVSILLLSMFLLLSLRPAFRWDQRAPVCCVLPPHLVALLPLVVGIARVECCCR